MKDSLAYRGSVLWNILIGTDKQLSKIRYKDIEQKRNSLEIFKDVSFNVISASTISLLLTNLFIFDSIFYNVFLAIIL